MRNIYLFTRVYSLYCSVMPPGQLHAVYTPVASFATGGHFYHYECMHLTELSRYLDAVVGDCLTNQMLHNALETLRRMMIAIPRLSPRIRKTRLLILHLYICLTFILDEQDFSGDRYSRYASWSFRVKNMVPREDRHPR